MRADAPGQGQGMFIADEEEGRRGLLEGGDDLLNRGKGTAYVNVLGESPEVEVQGLGWIQGSSWFGISPITRRER